MSEIVFSPGLSLSSSILVLAYPPPFHYPAHVITHSPSRDAPSPRSQLLARWTMPGSRRTRIRCALWSSLFLSIIPAPTESKRLINLRHLPMWLNGEVPRESCWQAESQGGTTITWTTVSLRLTPSCPQVLRAHLQCPEALTAFFLPFRHC